jgi:hypothetical protein
VNNKVLTRFGRVRYGAIWCHQSCLPAKQLSALTSFETLLIILLQVLIDK